MPGDTLTVPGRSLDQDASDETTPLVAEPRGATVTERRHSQESKDVSPLQDSPISLPRGLLCAVALGLLIFLQATNISLLTTTQSHIAQDLDAFEQTSWMTSAYLISMSSLSPLNGKLSSIFSPRICIFVSTIILAIGVVISGAAPSFATFLLGRILTGIGASGIYAVSMIIVLELASVKRRGLALGLLNSGFTLGVAVGATAAGAVLPLVGWRAIFYIQAPISLFGGTVLLLAIPHTFRATKGPSTDPTFSVIKRLSTLDYAGAVTLTLSIVLLLYPLSSPSHIPVLPLVLFPIVLLLFLFIETRFATDPIIPLPLLRSRGLLFTCLSTTGYMLSRWTVLFYTPTYALAVRGWSPSTAGGTLIPTNLGFALGGLAVGWLHIRRPGSFYLPTLAVYAVFPVTLAALGLLATRASPAWLVVLDVFLNGAVTGAALNYGLAHVLHLTPRGTHYVATALLATFRGFAGSFGSAIGGGLFARRLRASLEEGFARRGLKGQEGLVRRLLGQPDLVGRLEGQEKEVAVQGYEDALRLLFLSAAALAVVVVFIQAATGWKAAEKEEDDMDTTQNEQ